MPRRDLSKAEHPGAVQTRGSIEGGRAVQVDSETDYYGDNDARAAEWLRELIRDGLIPEGAVDERSIKDIRGRDLHGFRRCHFFAGIGGWAEAMRLAGWPAARPVWTGSCPCQPFSSAGRRKGEADERHLWPDFFRLISECRPATCFGEQVAGNDGYEWLARVRADLEAEGYAVGCADLPAGGSGAPQIRQRLFWVASAQAGGRGRRGASGAGQRRANEPQGLCDAGPVPGPSGFWDRFDIIHCTDGKARRVQDAESHLHGLADGIQRRMGVVCSEVATATAKEVISYANAAETDPREAMLDLQAEAYAAAIRDAAGGSGQFYEAAVLLAYLRQLAVQGWPVTERLLGASPEASQGRVRGVRGEEVSPRPPRQRRLDGQPAGEPTDALRVLSSILARHAHQARAHTDFGPDAGHAFPTSATTPGRVAMIRGFGNAIVPQAAAAFVRAFLDAEGDLT